MSKRCVVERNVAATIVAITIVLGLRNPGASLLAQEGPAAATIGSAAIIVGIGDYEHLPNRQFAREDAQLMSQVLKRTSRFGSVTVLADDPGSVGNRDEILNQFHAAVRKSVTGTTGTLLIYFSGYAYADPNGVNYLASPGTNPKSLETSPGLKISKLTALFDTAGGDRTVLVLLDCGRQSDTEALTFLLAGNPLLASFREAKNLIAIAASSEDQESHQHAENSYGSFAHAVADSLKGDADENGDLSISAGELFGHVFESVQESCAILGVEQTPEIGTYGRAAGSNIVARYRDTPATARQVKFSNRENPESGATVYVRIDGKKIEVAPEEEITVSCQTSSQLEFFAGTSGWRGLYETPTNSHDFQIAKQIAGRPLWTTGFTNSVGMHMTLVYTGRFMMGQSPADLVLLRRLSPNLSFSGELPAHEVELTVPYFIGTHEVTVGVFRAFTKQAGYRTDAEQQGALSSVFIDGTGDFVLRSGLSWRRPGFTQAEDHPVTQITWKDADRFCNWLTLKEQQRYSLPTEAQWEYAARAGTSTIFWLGNEPNQLPTVANVRDASLRGRFPRWSETLPGTDGFAFTSPVGTFRANPFGLHDMHGNVWEWCADWYDGTYYEKSPRQDPPGPLDGSYHVMRGGCFY